MSSMTVYNPYVKASSNNPCPSRLQSNPHVNGSSSRYGDSNRAHHRDHPSDDVGRGGGTTDVLPIVGMYGGNYHGNYHGNGDGHHRNGGDATPTASSNNHSSRAAEDDAETATMRKLRDELAAIKEELFETKATLATVEAESDHKVETARRKTEERVRDVQRELSSSAKERTELSLALAEERKRRLELAASLEKVTAERDATATAAVAAAAVTPSAAPKTPPPRKATSVRPSRPNASNDHMRLVRQLLDEDSFFGASSSSSFAARTASRRARVVAHDPRESRNHDGDEDGKDAKRRKRAERSSSSKRGRSKRESCREIFAETDVGATLRSVLRDTATMNGSDRVGVCEKAVLYLKLLLHGITSLPFPVVAEEGEVNGAVWQRSKTLLDLLFHSLTMSKICCDAFLGWILRNPVSEPIGSNNRLRFSSKTPLVRNAPPSLRWDDKRERESVMVKFTCFLENAILLNCHRWENDDDQVGKEYFMSVIHVQRISIKILLFVFNHAADTKQHEIRCAWYEKLLREKRNEEDDSGAGSKNAKRKTENMIIALESENELLLPVKIEAVRLLRFILFRYPSLSIPCKDDSSSTPIDLRKRVVVVLLEQLRLWVDEEERWSSSLLMTFVQEIFVCFGDLCQEWENGITMLFFYYNKHTRHLETTTTSPVSGIATMADALTLVTTTLFHRSPMNSSNHSKTTSTSHTRRYSLLSRIVEVFTIIMTQTQRLRQTQENEKVDGVDLVSFLSLLSERRDEFCACCQTICQHMARHSDEEQSSEYDETSDVLVTDATVSRVKMMLEEIGFDEEDEEEMRVS